MTYSYTVSTTSKRVLRGAIRADSEDAAEAALHHAGYQVLSLKEGHPGISAERLLPTLLGVRPQHVVDLSQQLADLMESGVNIVAALRLLRGQTSRPSVRTVIAGLVEELEEGGSVSGALAKYPEVFPYAYRQVMTVSEQAGNLETGLRQVTAYMERQLTIKKKVTRALGYPAVVLVMAVGVVALFVTIVLPPMAALFASFGTELPWTTRTIIAAADFFVHYGAFVLGASLAGAALILLYCRAAEGRLVLDRLLLRMPIVGPLNVDRSMAHFCQTAAMLLRAGLPLPQIMSTVLQTAGNRVVRQALQEVREQLIQGQGLAGPIAANTLFPHLIAEMLAVGETTGHVDSTLATLANFYQQRADRKIDSLTSMIEPVLTAAIGLLVALIAVSIVTPLYSVLGAVQ